MNETEARTVLILRAFEAPVVTPWSTGDAEAVTREAARDVGEMAPPGQFLSRRATLAASRLAERDATAAAALRGGIASIGASLSIVALVVAFGLGFASDSVAANGRINLLAPPLLGLMAWNLAVYAALLFAWLRRRRTVQAGRIDLTDRGSKLHPMRAVLTDALQRWMATPRGAAGPWPRFAKTWADASRPLQMQRMSALLHAGAVLFACGALASLYLHGLVFEYRAGWASTFLTPTAVHAWLSGLLGPASNLGDIPLPTVDTLAALRFSEGSGENAARWIHLYAITVAGLVIWPRGWLAAAALRRARRISAAFPIDLRERYFQRLLRGRGGASLRCRLLPYSHRPEAAAVDALGRLIEQASGQRATLQSLAPVDQGDEDDAEPIARRIGGDDSLLLVLFTLAATPERETQGRLLDTLRTIDPRRPLVVLVDEASFAQRFAAMPNRVTERRAAWSRMLQDVGRIPAFVDLASNASTHDEAALAAAIEAATAPASASASA